MLLLLAATVTLGLIGIQWGLPTSRRREMILPGASTRQLQSIARASLDADDAAATQTDDTISAAPATLKTYFRTLLYSYHPDEYLVLKALRGLPRLNPGVYRYGGPMLFGTALFIAGGSAVGLIEVTGDAAWYLEHPEQFGRFYLAARLFVVAMTVLLVYAAYRFGCLFGGEMFGLLTAALVMVMPATVNWMHVAKPHLPACAFVFLCAEMTLRYWRDPSGGRKWLVLAGLFSGLAAAMALSFSFSLAMPVTAIVAARWRTPRAAIGHLVLAGLCFVIVVLATNPWYVMQPMAVWAEVHEISGDVADRYMSSAADGAMAELVAKTARFFSLHLPRAMSWPVAVLGLVSLLAAVGNREARLLIPAWLLTVAGAVAAVGGSSDPTVARFALMPAVLLAPAIVGLVRCLVRRQWATVLVTALLAAVVLTVWSVPYLAVYRSDSGPHSSRNEAARSLVAVLNLDEHHAVPIEMGTIMPPAAYNLPPIPLSNCHLVPLSERRAPADGSLPQYLLLDSNVVARCRDPWWEKHYVTVNRLPSESPDRRYSWDDAPMSMADLRFFLLKRTDSAVR
ncbi:MAG: glycosyltransferase family 39 protein [Planctomycetes bacterium]|nr:glycosyltransferase family 39 protein [Planctomycetota bacterium]